MSPKEAAARAAEVRTSIHISPPSATGSVDTLLTSSIKQQRASTQGQATGKLGQKLNQQKQQSQTATLAENAKDNVAVRDADAAAKARDWQ